MALANYFVEYTDLKQVWFIISPHNPLKSKKSLLNDQLRLEMAELAIGNDERFAICDIEFRMPKPSYTIDTLTYLSEKHPKKEFILLMGSDSLETFHKWKNHEQIIDRYHRYIYPRNTKENTDCSQYLNMTFLKDAPRIEISSSFIRKALKEERNVKYFLNDKVYEFIIRNHLYQ